MSKKVLIFFPSTADRGRIATFTPTLMGIAKSRGWKTKYFDTNFYEKDFEENFSPKNSSAIEKIGGFKKAPKESELDLKPNKYIVEDLQKNYG